MALSQSPSKLNLVKLLRRACALTMLLLLVPMSQIDLIAQQAYGGQYAPYPQQGYAPLPQGYGTPPASSGYPNYSQPGYPQQYGQPYPQPGYVPQQSSQPQPQVYGPPYAQTYGQSVSQAQPRVQPLDAAGLEQLVAPIALYPDTLVAQVLAASTYPSQVVQADRWRQGMGNASPYDVAGAADGQNWDPSVKALTAFPQVLQEMDQNLRWTTDLGNAYYNQPQDVLMAVQVLRQRAQAAGTLQSSPQEAVLYERGNIELAPANPQMVYVPQYNPWTVYGDPITPYQGFSLLSALGSFFNSTLGSNVVRYGLGIAISAFTHTTWGWLGWGLSWLAHAILFNHSTYASHSTTVANWGIPQGTPHAFAALGAGGYLGASRSGYSGTSSQAYGTNRVPVRPLEAYNHAPAPIVRTQPAARPAYPANFYNGGGSAYGGSAGYSTPNRQLEAYNRSPSQSFERGEYGQRASGAYKAPKSSGSSMFGGGEKYKEPKYSQPKYSAPKYSEPKYKEPKFKEPKFKEPKSSGGGHASGGKHHLF